MIAIILLVSVVLPLIIWAFVESGASIMDFLYLNGIVPMFLLIFSGGFLILGVIIAYSYPRFGKIMAYVGIAGVLLSLLFIEVGVAALTTLRDYDINPSGNLIKDFMDAAKRRSNFQYCENIPVLISIGNEKKIQSLSDSLSCIITGYVPEGSSSVYMIGFWIFGVIMPLILTSGIFLDLVESSGVVKNRISQRMIGWSLGFLAYRGFIVTGMIFILDFAAAGMAVIALNFIFIGGLLSYTNKIFDKWKPLENVINTGNSAKLATFQIKKIIHEAINGLRNNSLTIEAAKNMISANLYLFDQAQAQGLKQKVTSAFSKNNNNEFAKELEKILKEM